MGPPWFSRTLALPLTLRPLQMTRNSKATFSNESSEDDHDLSLNILKLVSVTSGEETR